MAECITARHGSTTLRQSFIIPYAQVVSIIMQAILYRDGEQPLQPDAHGGGKVEICKQDSIVSHYLE